MPDIGTTDMVMHGRIPVRPGAAAIEADAVRCADGGVQAFDAISFATG